jgi:hypothetical protein
MRCYSRIIRWDATVLKYEDEDEDEKDLMDPKEMDPNPVVEGGSARSFIGARARMPIRFRGQIKEPLKPLRRPSDHASPVPEY